MECGLECTLEPWADARTGGDPGYLGHSAYIGGHARRDLSGIRAELLEDGGNDSALLVEQGEQKVLRFDLLLAVLLGDMLRVLDRVLGFDCQFVESHLATSLFGRRDILTGLLGFLGLWPYSIYSILLESTIVKCLVPLSHASWLTHSRTVSARRAKGNLCLGSSGVP